MARSQDLYTRVQAYIDLQDSISFIDEVPSPHLDDVFPVEFRRLFSKLFRRLFDSMIVPDILKQNIQSALKIHLPDYPDMHFFWTEVEVRSQNLLDVHILDNLWVFFKNHDNSEGFNNDYIDFLSDYILIFFTSCFGKDHADLLFYAGEMDIQEGINIITLKDYFCALHAYMSFGNSTLISFKEFKYQPFLSLYFRFRLLYRSIEKLFINQLTNLRTVISK